MKKKISIYDWNFAAHETALPELGGDVLETLFLNFTDEITNEANISYITWRIFVKFFLKGP